MNKIVQTIVSLIVLISSVHAEGTKQLRPQESNFGNLHLRPGDNNYTPFGLYGAPDDNQIKLYIGDTSEKLYFGFNNRSEGGFVREFVEGVDFRIVSPSGNIVYESVMPNEGEEGNILNWDEAVAGPEEIVGAGGYDALELTFTEIGDYIIEFDPPGNQYVDIHLFDFTVVDASDEPIDGRLHSKGWQITAESFDNPFSGTLYPYHPDGVVYEVDFNDIRPYLFIINFNSTGTDSTGNFIEDRRSRHYNRTYPEFEVFLNPPDEEQYPRFKREIYFSASVVNNSCDDTEICMTFLSNAPGEVEGFLDFNGNGEYDEEEGELYFGRGMETGVETCIEWDGLDANGNQVDQREMQMISSFGYGVMHLPIYDAENHENGYRVRVHSPEGLSDPALHWDDTEIQNKGRGLDGITNLDGCTNTSGCHRWRNRGERNNYSETINTWWYSEVMYDTLEFVNVWNRPVSLSFDPDVLDQEPRTICEGDSMTFYIHNDGAHFDTTTYTYQWYAGDAVGTDVREIKRRITEETLDVVVSATDKSAFRCKTQDVLTVYTVPPVDIEADIVDVSCTTEENSISITINSSPPDVEVVWEQFPGVSDLSVSDLDPGVYSLHIEDPNYSASCALDTSFELTGYKGIVIEELVLNNSFCHAAAGDATVTMEDLSRTYQYIWNGSASSNNVVTGLSPGNHTLQVREPSTGCTADSTFEITGEEFDFSLSSTNEVCGNGTGTVSVELPESEGNTYEIYFNGNREDLTEYEGLSSGDYIVRIVSDIGPGCEAQHTAVVGNDIQAIFIDELNINPSECYAPTGSVSVTMEDLSRTYKYIWDGGEEGNVTSLTSLPSGSHSLEVIDANTTCSTDSTFTIPELPLIVAIEKENELCGDSKGSISLTLPESDFYITWNGDTGTASIDNLNAGNYAVNVVSAYSLTCSFNDITSISNVVRDIPLDDITIGPSDCGIASGYASFSLFNTGRNYLFSWEGNEFNTIASYNQLNVGEYVVSIKEEGTLCQLDTVVQIPGDNFTYERIVEDEFCGNANGGISITVEDPNATILWADGATTFERTDLVDGTYSFTLTNSMDGNCVATGQLFVNDDQSDVNADFSYYSLVGGDEIGVGDVVQFRDESRGNIASYAWDFDDGGSSGNKNPEHIFDDAQMYVVQLNVIDIYGCESEVRKPLIPIKRDPCGAVLPNAFSPNDDRMNDDIGLLGTANDVDLKIYNRWGEVVFRGYNDVDRWDGTYRGEDAPVGAYPYILEYTCPDNRGRKVKEKKVGDISLIR